MRPCWRTLWVLAAHSVQEDTYARHLSFLCLCAWSDWCWRSSGDQHLLLGFTAISRPGGPPSCRFSWVDRSGDRHAGVPGGRACFATAVDPIWRRVAGHYWCGLFFIVNWGALLASPQMILAGF